MALPLGLWPLVTIWVISKYWQTCRTIPCISSGALSEQSSSNTPREKMMRFMIAWHTRSIFRLGRNSSMVSREQIHHDQNFAIVHAVEIYPVSLPRQKQFLLRSWVEIQIQLLPSPISPDAPGASRANCFDGCIHSWPIVQRVQNVVHLGGA
jgi:hypothetical protein